LKKSRHNLGFTLVEVLAAAMIGAFVAAVAIASLRTVAAAREKVDINIASADEMRFAAAMMQNDLANLYRDRDTNFMEIEGGLGEDENSPATTLKMNIVSPVKARFDGIESDFYEVEYFITKKDEKSFLMRRLCPLVGNEKDDQKPLGVMTPIAENITEFIVMYHDGVEWQDQWPQELETLPSLIEVTLMGLKNPDSEKPELVTKNFIVDFPRTGLPSEASEEDEDGDEESAEDNNENKGNG